MAVSKVILNGNTLIDVTQKTVTSGSMLSGTTSLKNDGTDITGNIATKTSTDMTVSGGTVTAPAGYYASAQSKSVASGTAGTPTATKGTVSNHSVTITPSVTNATGYITGGTKTGTAVTVSASELVSGTININNSGFTDVSNYTLANVPSGLSGTPTATKSAVSNHSVTVTPSVTNTAGYIIGGTYVGSAVTVDVTELESGTKTITENGTGISVSGYSTVDVNVSGGGGVTVESLSVTQNGTYTAPTGKAYTPVTVNVSGGGGGSNAGVKFYDYDGTLLHSYTPQEFAQLSALPANPSHTGLVAQGWNWSKQDIEDYLDDYPEAMVNVGQMYITASGKTEIDVRFEDPDFLNPYLAIAPNGTVEIDWGDGSSTDTVTGTSLTIQEFTQHVYAQTGSYTIKLTVSSGSFTFYTNGTTYPSVLVKDNKATSNYNKAYATCVTAIRLGNGVTSIGSNAFAGCYSLTSLTIPSSVTSIGTNAFAGCYSLTSLTIPSSVTSIGASVFQNCYSLTSITIPNTVTSIGTSAFAGCYSLTSLTIPSSVTSIGTSVFQNCYSLTSITIPNTVTSIGNGMLQYCYSLTSLTIPSSVTSIGTNAFAGCYSLTSLTIPSSVTSIGTSAFAGCYSLTSLTIPNTVTSIGNNAFQNCYTLPSLTIPSGCTVGHNVFQGCALFTSLPVPLPSDATDIKNNEFQNCYSLTSVTIPNTVTSIGNNAFQYCYSLTSLTIPSLVTSIGTSAFYNCHSLTSLTIPANVTAIGNSAFYNIYSMRELHFKSTTPPTLGGTNVFSGVPSDCIIYVPYSEDHSILNAYKTATNYTSQASKMQEEPNN